MREYSTWLKVGFIFFLSAALRSWNFRHGEPPGFEEIVASLAVVNPLTRYFHLLQVDLCPPVYYLVLKPVSWCSTKLWVFRLVSLFFGAATPAVLYWTARHVFGERTAWMGALLLAPNPLHVFYSQEAQPLALFAFVAVLTLYFFLRTVETDIWPHWIALDACLFALLHLHREAAFVVLSFCFLHIVYVVAYPLAQSSRRTRSKRAQHLILNYVLIAILATPWLAIMPTKAEWFEPKPHGWDLPFVFVRESFWGLWHSTHGRELFLSTAFFIILLPALVRALRRGAFVYHATAALTVLIPGLPYVWSFVGRTRFALPQTAALALPFMTLTLGILIGWCRPLLRFLLLSIALLAFGYSTAKQGNVRDKVDYVAYAKAVESVALPNSVLVCWPDFASQIGNYFFGTKYQVVPASDFFEKWAVIPQDQDVYFSLFQFPWKSAHPYTFVGALRHYAQAEIIWREKLNFAVRARQLNVLSLRLWYDDPESLNIVDRPTTQTQFLFLPNDPVFRNNQFYWDRNNLSYELDGRRAVWMKGEQAVVRLPVALQAGSYILRIHCSSDFECPDTAEQWTRTTSMQLRLGDEQKQATVQGEAIVELPFTSETELTSLNLILTVESELRAECPEPLHLGLKIYSIGVDQVGGPEQL